MGLELLLGSIMSLLGFPPKMLKSSLSHLQLKDEIGLEGQMSQREGSQRLQEIHVQQPLKKQIQWTGTLLWAGWRSRFCCKPSS